MQFESAFKTRVIMAANLTRLLEHNLRNSNAAAAKRSLRLFSNKQQQQSDALDDEGKQVKFLKEDLTTFTEIFL